MTKPADTHPAAPSALALTPGGAVIATDVDSPPASLFSVSDAAGLVALGGRPAEAGADATVLFWKSFADTFLRALCQLPEGRESLDTLPKPETGTLAEWVLNAPPMPGAEYLSPDILLALWARMEAWTRDSLTSCGSLPVWLERYAPAWTRVGRVTIHLAENPGDAECPFAFLASYA